MKHFTLLLCSALYFTALSASDAYTIELIEKPGQKWRLQDVTVEVTEQTTRVNGLLSAFHRFGLPSGHLDVVACSPRGELIELTTTDYTPDFLTQRIMKQGGIRFSAEFSRSLPADTIIKVAFHRGEIRPQTDPNICRKLVADDKSPAQE